MITLNKEQKDAVAKTDGSLLIIASAGTGKTTTIVERYVNLVENCDVYPDEVLMTTFTNKAAKDMINKISKRTDKIPGYIGTMHSLFLRMLRDNWKYVLDNGNFTLITDENDKKKIIRDILKLEDMSWKGDDVKYFLNWIARFKNRGILAESLSEEYGGEGEDEEEETEELIDDELIKIGPRMRAEVNKIYRRYQDYLKRNNAVDFDEILLLVYKLFDEHSEVREKYSNQFKHIMVDEAQDLNDVQVKILELLKRDNLCLIGDDCQNIYEWRGSSNDMVFDFSENENSVFLKENYRSTKEIIENVNKVINGMSFKIDKELKCTRDSGEDIKIAGFNDFEDESGAVVSQIQELIRKGEKKDEIAILFRTNRIGQDIERKLRKAKIPCYLSKSKGFFDREEIKDFVSFLRLKINQNSILDFERMGKLLDGVGVTRIERFKDVAYSKDCSLVEALGFAKDVCSEVQLEEVSKFKKVLEDFSGDVIGQFMDEFGYGKKLGKKYESEERKLNDKLANLDILFGWFSSGSSEKGKDEDEGEDKEGDGDEDKSEDKNKEDKHGVDEIRDFLDGLIDIEKKERTKDRVVLTTIHGSKGLEWKHVFLIACNEGILPFCIGKKLSKVKRDSELRLFYVAISRAKDNLNISYCYNLWWRQYEPSTFLGLLNDYKGAKRYGGGGEMIGDDLGDEGGREVAGDDLKNEMDGEGGSNGLDDIGFVSADEL